MRNAARKYTAEAIETLVLVMRNGKPGEAVMAANSLLDRGWGKPTLPLSGGGGGPLIIVTGVSRAQDGDTAN